MATLACLLAAAILFEIQGGERPQAVPGSTLAAPAPGTAARGRVPDATVSAAALQGWSRTILERPLFSPSRRPGQAAAASSAAPPRLAGIIIGPGGARAIFASTNDSRAIVAGNGAHVGPYLIRLVGPAGVSVIGPNGPELLRPVYDHAATRGEAAAPIGGAVSILDLLRNRVQSGESLRSSLLPAPARQTAPNGRR